MKTLQEYQKFQQAGRYLNVDRIPFYEIKRVRKYKQKFVLIQNIRTNCIKKISK